MRYSVLALLILLLAACNSSGQTSDRETSVDVVVSSEASICEKMGYNGVMVHAYGNNPMVKFSFNGVDKPAGQTGFTFAHIRSYSKDLAL